MKLNEREAREWKYVQAGYSLEHAKKMTEKEMEEEFKNSLISKIELTFGCSIDKFREVLGIDCNCIKSITSEDDNKQFIDKYSEEKKKEWIQINSALEKALWVKGSDND